MHTKELDATMWADVEAVLGPQGGDEGCWCMGWRSRQHLPAEEAKAALRQGVESGRVYARIAYDSEGRAVGWCTYGPREHFYHAQAHLKKADHLPTADEAWAIPCFFIKASHRGQGIATLLLGDVLESIQRRGGALAEAYPFDHALQDQASLKDGESAEDWAFTGSLSLFQKAGFTPRHHCINGCLHYCERQL